MMSIFLLSLLCASSIGHAHCPAILKRVEGTPVHDPNTRVFKGSTFGVRTTVLLETPHVARITVKGVGFRQSGSARFDKGTIHLDCDLERFLSRRHIHLRGMVHMDVDRIGMDFQIPLIGNRIVWLVRE